LEIKYTSGSKKTNTGISREIRSKKVSSSFPKRDVEKSTEKAISLKTNAPRYKNPNCPCHLFISERILKIQHKRNENTAWNK